MDLTEKTLSRREIYDGRIVHLHVDEVELPDGSCSVREVIDHCPCVAVVALDEQDRVLTVTQYRYAFGRELLEIPAGKLEPGEDPVTGALRELREEVAQCLGMEERRVSMAGNHYAKSAFSEELDLERPEYATPLGIAISAGLGLLNDSYLVMLNGQPAKLFRSGTLTLRDILLMNGYTYEEILGKSGKSLSVTLDGRRVVLRGEPAAPAVLRLNGEDAPVSAMVHAGDQISFIPARSGADAARTLAELLGRPVRALVNNREAPADTQLKQGDVILTLESPASVAEAAAEPAAPYVSLRTLDIVLNEKPLHLDGKEDGAPYYLMDLLKFSGLDFDHLEQPVRLEVNGAECGFRQVLKDGDSVTIACV